jgi:hypothetical protein
MGMRVRRSVAFIDDREGACVTGTDLAIQMLVIVAIATAATTIAPMLPYHRLMH